MLPFVLNINSEKNTFLNFSYLNQCASYALLCLKSEKYSTETDVLCAILSSCRFILINIKLCEIYNM
jgi:hypothetical protein